jgi:hypothetical protein
MQENAMIFPEQKFQVGDKVTRTNGSTQMEIVGIDCVIFYQTLIPNKWGTDDVCDWTEEELRLVQASVPGLDLRALRDKHRPCVCGYCSNNECEAGCIGEYPCDVIKVLDATESSITDIRASTISDVLPTNECNHPEGGLIPNSKGELGVIEFAYCPKCGEKL